MSDFEKFLQKNKEQLKQTPQANPALWHKIEASLPQQKEKHFSPWLKAAASVALLVSIYVFYPSVSDVSSLQASKNHPSWTIQHELFTEVERKKNHIDQLPFSQEQNELFHILFQGLEDLQRTALLYQNQLLESEKTWQFLVTNYQQQLELLNEIDELYHKTKGHDDKLFRA